MCPSITVTCFLVRRFSSFETFFFRGRPFLLFIKRFSEEEQIFGERVPPRKFSGVVRLIFLTKIVSFSLSKFFRFCKHKWVPLQRFSALWNKKNDISCVHTKNFSKMQTLKFFRIPFLREYDFSGTSILKASWYFSTFRWMSKSFEKTNIEYFCYALYFDITTFLRNTEVFWNCETKKLHIKIVTPLYCLYKFPYHANGPSRVWAVLGLLSIKLDWGLWIFISFPSEISIFASPS